MALSAEDKAELRAMMVEVVAGAYANLERQIGERIEGFQGTLRDVQVDVALGLDKLDVIEIDVKDIKSHSARVSREHIKDRLRLGDLDKRIAEFEARLSRLEKGAGP